MVDGRKPNTTKVTYRSFVDVATVVPTATVRDIAIGKVKDMIGRVRKACDGTAAKSGTTPPSKD